jgi:hypothetical protein
VDVGGVAAKRRQPIDRAEAAERTAFILRAMGEMGYEAVGIGIGDRHLGETYFTAAQDAGLKVIASLGDYAGKHDNVVPSLVKQFGKHKVGFAAIPQPDRRQARLAYDPLVECLQKLRKECGTVILLSQLGYSDDVRLVARPALRGLVDVLIGNGKAKVINDLTREHNGVTFVRNEDKGGHLFTLAVRTGWFSRPRFVCQDFLLGPELAEDPRLRREVDAYHEQWEKRFLTLSAGLMPPPAERRLIPSSACARCHPEAYETWADSGHAHAVATLREAGKRVPDCLKCHSQTYRQLRVFVDNHREPQGVECVTCHLGAPERHMKERTRADVKRAVGEGSCTPCHTPTNSPHFDYLDYRERIRHWAE